MLRRVGDVLLDPSQRGKSSLKRWLVGRDAFDLAEKPARLALYQVNQGGPVLPGYAECAQHALSEGQKLRGMHCSTCAICARSAISVMCICILQKGLPCMRQLQRVGCGAASLHMFRHCRPFREICQVSTH